jgi:tetratricopeptide (TPR) repeat protein
MQRRRSQSQARRTRTPSVPATPPAAVTWFPKGRPRLKTDTDATLPVARVRDRDTDPLGERAKAALEADRLAHGGRPPVRTPDRDALAYHRQKLNRLLQGDPRALVGLSSRELMEVAALGHGLYEQGRLEEARVVFEGLVAMELREAFPYTVLGAIYLSAGDAGRALALFEAALALDGDDPAALCYRGEIRLQLGQRAKGLLDLRRAVAVDTPGSPFGARAQAALGPTRGTRGG